MLILHPQVGVVVIVRLLLRRRCVHLFDLDLRQARAVELQVARTIDSTNHLDDVNVARLPGMPPPSAFSWTEPIHICVVHGAANASIL